MRYFVGSLLLYRDQIEVLSPRYKQKVAQNSRGLGSNPFLMHQMYLHNGGGWSNSVEAVGFI